MLIIGGTIKESDGCTGGHTTPILRVPVCVNCLCTQAKAWAAGSHCAHKQEEDNASTSKPQEADQDSKTGTHSTTAGLWQKATGCPIHARTLHALVTLSVLSLQSGTPQCCTC